MADEATPAPLPPQPSLIAAAPRTEPLAIVSLVLAIVSCLFVFTFPVALASGVAAVICAHLGRSKIRKSGGTLSGMGVTLAGLVIGYIGLAVAIVFTVFAGAMVLDMIRSDRARLHDLANEKKEIASDDGKLKITTSGFWVKRTDLNKRASLQAARPGSEMYLIAISDPKSNLGNMTLQQRHQAATDDKLKRMTHSSASTSAPVTIDGHPALQDEVTGTQDGTDLTFLHTTLDDGDSFDQVIGWTLKSRWAASEAELREVTNSFHVEK